MLQYETTNKNVSIETIVFAQSDSVLQAESAPTEHVHTAGEKHGNRRPLSTKYKISNIQPRFAFTHINLPKVETLEMLHFNREQLPYYNDWPRIWKIPTGYELYRVQRTTTGGGKQ